MLFSLHVLFAIVLLARIAQLLYRRFLHLHNFRGPKLAAWTRLWLAKTYSTERASDIFLELNNIYGVSDDLKHPG
jgi:hypothetical protein